MLAGKHLSALSATTTSLPSTDTDTAARLRLATARLWRRLRDAEPRTGLTQTEMSVLFTVSRCGPVRMSDLAREEDVNPTMLSRVVAGLAERGLLDRAPDPDDRRAVVVAATDAGLRLRDESRRARTAVLAEVLEGLQPAEERALEQALPVLERLAAALKEPRA
jgi:DNA-binding MarR family transcriptional regulator